MIVNYNLILIAIAVTILIIIAIGFSAYNPEPVEGQEMKMCFSRFEDFVKEKLKHINDTDFEIIFPCEEFNKSAVPEDESGK